jgi:hypothetical protein
MITHAMLDTIQLPKESRIIECCSGEGHLAYYLEEMSYGVVTNDVDMSTTALYHYDATKEDLWERTGCHDVVVSEPPIGVSHTIIQRAIDSCGTVIMLLPLYFLEPSKERREFLVWNMPDIIITVPRTNLVAADKRGKAMAWMIWDKQRLLSMAGLHSLQLNVE